MQFLTSQFFDTLIIAVILIGLALAAVRLYADLTRPINRRLTRVELLDAHQAAYDRFKATLAKLTPEQMLEPNVVGAWSVKDVVAHLIFWNRFPVAQAQAALDGERYRLNADEDTINAHNVEAHRPYPLEAVIAEFDQSFRAVMDLLENLPPSAFAPHSLLERRLGDTLTGAFASSTYAHYDLHREQIEAWMHERGLSGDTGGLAESSAYNTQ